MLLLSVVVFWRCCRSLSSFFLFSCVQCGLGARPTQRRAGRRGPAALHTTLCARVSDTHRPALERLVGVSACSSTSSGRAPRCALASRAPSSASRSSVSASLALPSPPRLFRLRRALGLRHTPLQTQSSRQQTDEARGERAASKSRSGALTDAHPPRTLVSAAALPSPPRLFRLRLGSSVSASALPSPPRLVRLRLALACLRDAALLLRLARGGLGSVPAVGQLL